MYTLIIHTCRYIFDEQVKDKMNKGSIVFPIPSSKRITRFDFHTYKIKALGQTHKPNKRVLLLQAS